MLSGNASLSDTTPRRRGHNRFCPPQPRSSTMPAHSLNLNVRVALVTGGSRGIGRAISIALASAGAAVAVNYRQRIHHGPNDPRQRRRKLHIDPWPHRARARSDAREASRLGASRSACTRGTGKTVMHDGDSAGSAPACCHSCRPGTVARASSLASTTRPRFRLRTLSTTDRPRRCTRGPQHA
ncbi:SDR family NAD(P)-dependent oxidoreductase [Paraburkholderia sp. MM5477-R1]|uniref:SDR family NAD(P)-dependent oxidoreductase n=1 Tax=Paraburkholderia sp. MM5477-R1 TaxID=2991062 RepID=UPI003D2148FA